VADGDRPRPSPRPRRGETTATRPSPRPRVAGARRDRDEVAPGPSPRPAPAVEPESSEQADAERRRPRARRERPAPAARAQEAPRRGPLLLGTLLVLVVAAAAGGSWLLWERLNPSSVRTSVLDGTRDAVEALYAYDYRDSDGSVQGKLAVLTGDLRDQYAKDLEAGSIDAYEQVSATTRYEIDDIGLKRINEAQDSATVLVFGRYVVDSVTSGEKDAPEGSACEVTPEGAQACTQILRLDVVDTDDGWKIEDYAILASGG
jgi:hypothetical protein